MDLNVPRNSVVQIVFASEQGTNVTSKKKSYCKNVQHAYSSCQLSIVLPEEQPRATQRRALSSEHECIRLMETLLPPKFPTNPVLPQKNLQIQ